MAFEARGYRSTYLNHGGCARACTRWPRGDDYTRYDFHVVIDELVTRVEFLHKDGPRSRFMPGFACAQRSSGWECAVE